MGVYDRQIASAIRQISAKGQSVTWRKHINGAPLDPEKPWNGSALTTEEHIVSILFLPLNLQTKKFADYMSNSSIHMGGEGGFMAAVDFEPSIKDEVVRDGKTLTIENFDLIAPNGDPILYILEFAK